MKFRTPTLKDIIMFNYRILLFLALLLTGHQAIAQLSEHAAPKTNTIELKAAPMVTMPSIDIPALMAEDEEDLASNLPLRFAYGHQVNLNMDNTGRWEVLPNGDRVWRLAVKCPDALNINFLYSDFYLPAGGQLFLYNSDKSQVLGAFTERNNKKTRRFATALIHGDVAVLEYYEPKASKGKGSIQIAQVGHGYRTMNNPIAEDAGQLGNSGDCQVNVNCEEGANWQDEKKGVGKIVMDGLYLCTGTLVNNTANDCKPYFLTANHCIQGGIPQDAILNPDVSGYIFYWNFEYQNCTSGGFVPEQTTNGGTVVANAGPNTTGTYTLTGSDFALIQLDENPRDAYDVYFNGWDATGDQGNGGVGIHHPAGDAKKISTHGTTPSVDGYYWALYWDATVNGHSVTEGGSSGSALFRENGRIIGQLFGGGSVNCDDPANDLGLYGRLDYSWTNADELIITNGRRLDVWLDPVGGGSIRTVGGAYDPCEVPVVYFPTTGMTVNEGNTTTNSGCLDYADYTFDIAITPYPTSPVTVDIHAFATNGAVAGANRDFELLTPSVTFNSIFNQQSIQVRVYNDEYVEGPETIHFGFTVSGVATSMGTNDIYTIQISDNDAVPSSHIQSVSNEESPDEAYLGPGATVYFTDPGSGGMMLKVENLSTHDYGCTTVAVDKAGGSANNSWTNGTSTSKSYIITTDNPTENGAVAITAYFTNSELNGWEWFNGTPDDRDDLKLYRFNGAAVPANENSALAGPATNGNYSGGETFRAEFESLHALSGLTAGVLNNVQGLQIQNTNTQAQGYYATTDLAISPNPASSFIQVSWEATQEADGQLQVLDITGRILRTYNYSSTEGYNTMDLTIDDLQSGVYLLSLQTENGAVTTKRFVKR